MGLDSYLYRHTYVKNYHGDNKHKVTVTINGEERKDVKPERVAYIVEEVGYWRKFHELHQWFVDNCGDGEDDCKPVYVDNEKIKELIKVLENTKKSFNKNHLTGKVKVLTPIQNYDYFLRDVEDAIKFFKDLIKEEEKNNKNNLFGDFYYRGSW